MSYKILVKTICTSNSGQVAADVVQNVVEFETPQEARDACEKINGPKNEGTNHCLRNSNRMVIAYSTTDAILLF
jgi:hypothetical protein